MADISIDFIGRQLQSIQAELREIKFAAEVERRNSRSAFDNLVIEVGVKLGTFEAAIEHRLGAMDERLEAMDERLEAMDERLEAMDERLEAMGGQLGSVQQQLDQGLGGLQTQLDRIERLLTSRGAPS
jgi:archaellum component FlaC